MAELQTYIGDLKASAQGKGEDPVPDIRASTLSHPAGEVVGVVEVRQGGDVGVMIRSLEGIASADRDPVGGVDELRQAVTWTAIQVVAGVMRRSPAQWGVREGRGVEGWRKEREEQKENREERGGVGRGKGQDHHVIEPAVEKGGFKRKPWELDHKKKKKLMDLYDLHFKTKREF